jgi:hypothetical protein
MQWRYNITDARDIKEAGKRTQPYLRGAERATTCTNAYAVLSY